jgi:hypothetical protein
MRGLDQLATKAEAVQVSPPDGRSGTPFGRDETNSFPNLLALCLNENGCH